MFKALIATTITTTLLGASALAVAQPQQDRGVSADRYGYEMRVGTRDPYTDGAHGIRQRDVYTDGANGIRQRDVYTDGARGAASLNLAGMDRTGVSAPPEQRA
ncbi:hypothetical protein [Cupriavidus sp. BIS7]|uniref:hypothetical protein n=1 Tax=Cupriavidus sp. BIS7 TaxID=1217718 RepID=UPI0002DF03B5|nr:hypothetical protein [Cupriavidus sp. BIS7]